MKFTDIKQLYLERKLTDKEQSKREEIAKAIERENPGMGSTPEGMSKKMAIATATAKKCCHEEFDLLDETSKYDLVVTYYRHLGLDPYKLRGAVGAQLRQKIKDSPAFHAWLKVNHYENTEYEPANSLIETLKSAKKDSKSNTKGVKVTFFGYPDSKSTSSDSDKDQAQIDNNYITPN
jgi:hypothetical protein